MVLPPNFKSTSHPNVVCRFEKLDYGLKQAPRAWHSMIMQFLCRIGFWMSKSDNSLFIQGTSSGQIFLIIYIDNLVISGKHLVDINKVKMLLLGKFKMKDMNKLHYFLGIEVIQTSTSTMLSQCHYILNLLFKFGMMDHKPISTPLDQNMELHTDSGTPSELTQYHQIIGSLIYLTIT